MFFKEEYITRFLNKCVNDYNEKYEPAESTRNLNCQPNKSITVKAVFCYALIIFNVKISH